MLQEVLKERQEALAKVTQTMAEKEAEELERLAKATQASSALKDGSDSSAQVIFLLLFLLSFHH